MASEDVVPEPDVLQAMQNDPTLGGTLMALVSAVTRLVNENTRLADENRVLAERVSELDNLLEQRDGAEDAPPVYAVADADAIPEDIPDAEFVRLVHQGATEPVDEDTALDYTVLTEANW